MDDKFIDTLKTFSVKDIIEDVQRPTTSSTRLRTATARRGPRAPLLDTHKELPGTFSPSPVGVSTLESMARPGTSMVPTKASPLQSAFGGSNKSGSWRIESAAPNRDLRTRPGTTIRPPSLRQPLFSSSSNVEDDSDLNIPDLAEVAEEEFTQTVASAPEYEVQRLTSLRELDAELAKNKSFCIVDGIDLRKLARRMVPERKLVEMDDGWTYNSLYSELAARYEERRTPSSDVSRGEIDRPHKHI